MIRIVIEDYFNSEVAELNFNHSILDAEDGLTTCMEIAAGHGYNCKLDQDTGGDDYVRIIEANVDNSDDDAARSLKQLAGDLCKEFIL